MRNEPNARLEKHRCEHPEYGWSPAGANWGYSYCLHLWRPINEHIPRPPQVLV